MKSKPSKINLLFVCMGNICRSPSAEAVMKKVIENAGLSNKIHCDSAGTLGIHAGERADGRMIRHAQKREYELTSISRQIEADDFRSFDYIIAMDSVNLRDMQPFIPQGDFSHKIKLMTDFCTKPNPGYVPDPYYGGAEGFEQVLDILEDACEGLLKFLTKKHVF